MSKIEASQFKRLIGNWRTSGNIQSDNKTLKLSGNDCYEFVLGGNFILHKAEVLMGKVKSETIEMISPGNSVDKATMQYFNSRGESGGMTSQISGDNFQIHGDRIRFSGTINHENTRVTGKWYLQEETGDWSEYIALTLEKP